MYESLNTIVCIPDISIHFFKPSSVLISFLKSHISFYLCRLSFLEHEDLLQVAAAIH